MLPRPLLLLLPLALATPARGQAPATPLSRADSALVGGILAAEDARNGGAAALEAGLAHPDPRIAALARRAAARIADTTYAARHDGPAPPPVPAWPLPAWRLRYDALRSRRQECAALRAALADEAWPVRLRAADLAAPACARDTALVATLTTWATTPPRKLSRRPAGGISWHAAAHAVVALARLGAPGAAGHVTRLATSPEWHLRMYAARAATLLGDTATLRTLARDDDDNVREAAIDGLAARGGHAADDVYLEALGSRGAQAVRAAAVALAGSPHPELAAAADAAYRRWARHHKDSERDVRLALLALLRRAPSEDIPPAAPAPLPPDAISLALGREARVRVTMEPGSGGGSFVVRLRGDVAPITSARILELVRQRYYDGTTWHRIIPEFVAQGGGHGSNEYVGHARYFRDELGALSHRRGAVGMSTRGHDTGDAQWFVDLADNARLDPTYTVFGEVVEGMDVVDGLLEGDRIARIRIETAP